MSGLKTVRSSVRSLNVVKRLMIAFLAIWGFFLCIQNLSGVLTYLGWAAAGLISQYAPPVAVSGLSLVAVGRILRARGLSKGVGFTVFTVAAFFMLVLSCWVVPMIAVFLCAIALGGLLMDLLFNCPLAWLRTVLLSLFGSLVAAGAVFSELHQRLVSSVAGVHLIVQIVGIWWVVYACYLLMVHGLKFVRLEPGAGFKALAQNLAGLLASAVIAVGLWFVIPQAMWGFEFSGVKSTLEGAVYCYPMNPQIINPGSVQVLLAYFGVGCCIGNLVATRRVRQKKPRSTPTTQST